MSILPFKKPSKKVKKGEFDMKKERDDFIQKSMRSIPLITTNQNHVNRPLEERIDSAKRKR